MCLSSAYSAIPRGGHRDIISFTFMTYFPLQRAHPVPTLACRSISSVPTGPRPETTIVPRNGNKWIDRNSIGPTRWQQMQAPIAVLKPHPVFAPVVAIADQFELLLEQRMVGMGYTETSTRYVAMWRI